MDFTQLLNQVMNSGGDLARQAGDALGQNEQGGMSDMTKGALGGAVGGSHLTLLLGSKKGRKMGGKAAKLGGAAALGAVAYKVFNDWQAGQGGAQPQAFAATATPGAAPRPSEPPQTEQHSISVLKAMIAAAKADGHVDDAERERIGKALESLGAGNEINVFMQRELDKPLDPADVARGVEGPEAAAEIYLASLLMVDEQNFMEKAYLEELARQLQLAPDLVARLEAQAG